MSQNWNAHIISNCINFVVLYALVLSAQTRPAKAPIELHIKPGELVNGVPDTFSFIFVNVGDRDVWIPHVSPCVGQHSGRVELALEFSPVRRGDLGKSGGCAGLVLDHPSRILEEAKSWRRLKPGESFTISYKRLELFVFEQAPGAYEFCGEYRPPKLTAEEIGVLEHAGIEFASESLKSASLRFNRPD